MKHYNDKEFDRWLRENAASGNVPPAADGWDTPPEAVWTGLRAGLDQGKKRRRWLLLFWFGLMLGLGGSSLAYWFNISENTEQTSIATEMQFTQQQPDLKTIETAKTDKANNNITNTHPTVNTIAPAPVGPKTSKRPAGDQISFQAQTARIETIPQSFKPESEALTNLQKPEISSKNQSDSEVFVAKTGSTPETVPPGSEVVAAKTPALEIRPISIQTNSEVDTEAESTSDFKQMPLLPPLSVLPLLTLNFEQVKPSLQQVQIKPLRPSQTSLYAGAMSGVFFTTRKLKNARGLTPNGQESGAWTWQQGLQIGLKLNRHWAIETGIQRTSIRLQAEREVLFRYLTDRERFNPDRFIYQNTSDQNIQTSFGEVEMRMDISREPNRPITDQAFVKLNLHTDEQVHYLRVPLLLRWNTNTGPWQWNLNGGIALNFENGYELQMTAARSNRPGVRDISARAKSRVNGLAPMILDAQIGAGIQYRFTPKWSVRLAPEFRYGLSSMYRNGPFQSIAVSGGIQLGMIYGF